MLLEDDSQPKTLGIYDNSPNSSGGHSILPYRLRQDPVVKNLYYIFVYDNSNPASNNPITIDTTGNGNKGTWSTPDWYGWGGNKNIILEITADNYLNTEVFRKASEYKSPFILLDSTLEINYPGRSTVKIIDTKGNTTGYDNGMVFNEIPGSIADIVKNGSQTPPYGYTLPADNYSLILDNFSNAVKNDFFNTCQQNKISVKIIFSPNRINQKNNKTVRLRDIIAGVMDILVKIEDSIKLKAAKIL